MTNQPEFIPGLMPPEMGPPLPRFMGIYWPWYRPKEIPKEERPPVVAYPPIAYPPVAAPVVAYPPVIPPAPPVIVYPPRPEAPVPAPEVIYVCPECGAQFSTLSDWYAHMEEEHPAAPLEVPMEIFICPICGAQFSTFEELQSHMAEAHPLEFSITALSYPPGSGIVSTDKPKYRLGEQVRLTARPSPGYEFSHWEGIPGMPTDLTYRFPIGRDMIVTGVFRLLEKLPPEVPIPPPRVPEVVPPEVPIPPPPVVPEYPAGLEQILTYRATGIAKLADLAGAEHVVQFVFNRKGIPLDVIDVWGEGLSIVKIRVRPRVDIPVADVDRVLPDIEPRLRELAPPEVPPLLLPELTNLRVVRWPASLVVGDTCRIRVSFNYVGPRVSRTLYTAIGTIRLGVFDEIVRGSKTIAIPEAISITPMYEEVDIPITTAIRPGTYSLYTKIDSLMSPYLENVITIREVVSPLAPAPPVGYTLGIRIRPMAAGRVTKSPDKPTYTYGEIVKLTAGPVPQPFGAPKYKFSYWEVNGELPQYINPINYMVTKDSTVTALFKEV